MAGNQLVPAVRRAIVYIDGFNLYYALKEKKWQNMMWLDLLALGRSFMRPNQELVTVKYFTSRITDNLKKQKRQSDYLDALAATCGNLLQIIYGNYIENDFQCPCGRLNKVQGEKQTDVNIAAHIITDSHKNLVDDVILITADSDQVPSMTAAREMGKYVLIVMPPGREHYLEVQFAASGKLDLNSKRLRQCALPLRVTLPNGYQIDCPQKYR